MSLGFEPISENYSLFLKMSRLILIMTYFISFSFSQSTNQDIAGICVFVPDPLNSISVCPYYLPPYGFMQFFQNTNDNSIFHNCNFKRTQQVLGNLLTSPLCYDSTGSDCTPLVFGSTNGYQDFCDLYSCDYTSDCFCSTHEVLESTYCAPYWASNTRFEYTLYHYSNFSIEIPSILQATIFHLQQPVVNVNFHKHGFNIIFDRFANFNITITTPENLIKLYLQNKNTLEFIFPENYRKKSFYYQLDVHHENNLVLSAINETKTDNFCDNPDCYSPFCSDAWNNFSCLEASQKFAFITIFFSFLLLLVFLSLLSRFLFFSFALCYICYHFSPL